MIAFMIVKAFVVIVFVHCYPPHVALAMVIVVIYLSRVVFSAPNREEDYVGRRDIMVESGRGLSRATLAFMIVKAFVIIVILLFLCTVLGPDKMELWKD